jgi:DNA modification methylase
VPKLALLECAPADLIIPARNIRKIEPAHLHEVATSISSLGFCDPVLIDERNAVLDGVVRVEAAKLLTLAHIPCIRADHLNASERRLVRIALNRLCEKGSWDFDALKLELEELILEDAPITITGFSLPEIDQILLGDESAAVETGPLAPEPNAKPVVQVGDIFILGEHRIMCGDATDPSALEILMSDSNKARLVLTDEPYNVPIAGHVTSGEHSEFLMASGEMTDSEFRAFNTAWIGASLGHLRDGGLFATFIDWRGYPAVVAAASGLGLAPINLIVWAKANAGMGSFYRSQHELLPLFKKGEMPHVNNIMLGKNGRWRSNVWTYPGASSLGSDARKGLQEHPTVKPTAMLEDALLDMTKRGDIVIDPFLGSGSTLIACEKTGRRCRGLELDPRYVEVILRRYEAVAKRPAILESTGEPYVDLATRRRHEAELSLKADNAIIASDQPIPPVYKRGLVFGTHKVYLPASSSIGAELPKSACQWRLVACPATVHKEFSTAISALSLNGHHNFIERST